VLVVAGDPGQHKNEWHSQCLSPAVHCYNRKEAVLTITTIHIDIHISHSEVLFKKSKLMLCALSNKQKGNEAHTPEAASEASREMQ